MSGLSGKKDSSDHMNGNDGKDRSSQEEQTSKFLKKR
jgi:hypothetical protein